MGKPNHQGHRQITKGLPAPDVLNAAIAQTKGVVLPSD